MAGPDSFSSDEGEEGPGPFVLPFDVAPPRLTGAPGWAQQLADRIHEMEIRQQRDRHDAAHRDQIAVTDLQTLTRALGKESDDGKGGTGILGRLNRIATDVASLKDDRTKIRAAVATIVGTGFLLVLGLKTWLISLFHGVPK